MSQQRQLWPRSLCICGITIAMISGQIVLADEPSASQGSLELARLNEIWDRWDKKATSLDLAGYEFVGVLGKDETKVTRELVQELFRQVLPTTVGGDVQAVTLESLNAATAALYPPKQAGVSTSASCGAWSEVTFVCDSNNSRLDSNITGFRRTCVRRGTKEQEYRSGANGAGGQASLFTSHTGYAMPRIDAFLYTPRLPTDPRPWKLDSVDGSRRLLSIESNEGKGIFLEYDPDSGFVHYHGLRVSANLFLNERFQACPVMSPDGIPIPSLVADLHYRARDIPEVVRVFVVSRIELGKSIDPSRFEMSVPSGTTIVQFNEENSSGPSKDQERPPVMRATADIPDVESFAGTPEFQKATIRQPVQTSSPTPVRESNRMYWILIANFVAVGVVALIVWRQRLAR